MFKVQVFQPGQHKRCRDFKFYKHKVRDSLTSYTRIVLETFTLNLKQGMLKPSARRHLHNPKNTLLINVAFGAERFVSLGFP